MDCSQAENLATLVLIDDPAISVADRVAFDLHLQACTSCREAFAESRRVMEMVREYGKLSPDTVEILESQGYEVADYLRPEPREEITLSEDEIEAGLAKVMKKIDAMHSCYLENETSTQPMSISFKKNMLRVVDIDKIKSVFISSDEEDIKQPNAQNDIALPQPYQSQEVSVPQSNESQDNSFGLKININVIRQAATGDRQAFELLYLYFWPLLSQFIRKQHPMLGEHTAEDIASESLAQIWRERSKLSDVKNLSAYMKTIAVNMVARRFRAQRPDEVEGVEAIAVSGTTSHEALERDELARQVIHAMETLPRSHRMALEASQLGYSAKEIAARLGCTDNAARRLLQKARKNLAMALTRCGSACAVSLGRPDECLARQNFFYCIKHMYFQKLP